MEAGRGNPAWGHERRKAMKCSCGFESDDAIEFATHYRVEVERLHVKDDLTCPFCWEADFDLIGLKNHLENFCKEYLETISVEEEASKFRKIK